LLSKTLGFFAGFIATFAAISLVQALGHAVIPPPADLDVTDQAAFAEWLATAPAGSFLFVLASYFAGAFLGPFVATWLGGGRGLVFTWIFGALVLAGTIATVTSIPHPLWFTVTAIVGIPFAAFYGGRLAPRRVSPQANAPQPGTGEAE